MALLINKQTGLAEEVPLAQARELASTSHRIPVRTPEGEVVSTEASELPDLLKEGYQHIGSEESQKLLKKAKYGTSSQQLKTAAEGAADVLSGGFSTKAETDLLGVSSEDIKAREEENPKSRLAGEAAGLLAGEAMPLSAPAISARAAAKLVKAEHGIAAARAAKDAFVASSAAAADEVHKMFVQDPHQTVTSALAHVGLSGLMAGAVGGLASGGVEKLKNVKLDPKLTKMLGEARSMVWSEAPEVLGATIGGMMGGLPGIAAGGILGRIGKKIGDRAAGMATAKFLGYTGDISAQGYRALGSLAKSLVEGDRMLNKGMSAVFRAGTEEAGDWLSKKLPTSRDRDKLEAALDRLKQDPSSMSMGELATYGSEYAAAAAEKVARAMQYLDAERPDLEPKAPLDSKRTPPPMEVQAFNRKLDIAQQPLTLLDLLRKGTLTPGDIHIAQAVHPELLDLLRAKAMDQVADFKQKDKPIPHKVVNSLSMLIGQPLTSSTMPANIVSNQQVYQALGQQPQAPQKPNKRTGEAMQKDSKSLATPGQAREASKQVRK